MKKFALIALLALGACATSSTEAPSGAQKIVNMVAENHPELVRLTVHAPSADGKTWTAVASTAADRVGKPSDPEDAQAAMSAQNVVKREGQNVDVTVPVKMNGKVTSVLGITVCPCEGAEGTSVDHALKIADEVKAAMAASKEPLW